MPKGKPNASPQQTADTLRPEPVEKAPVSLVDFPSFRPIRSIGAIGLMETEQVEGSGKKTFRTPATDQNLSGKQRLFGVVCDKALGKGQVSVEISLDGENFSEAIASASVDITGKGVAVAVLGLEDIKAPYFRATLALDKAPATPCAVAMQLCVSR